jgi:hypothetical protein
VLERLPTALQGTGALIIGMVPDAMILKAPEAQAQEAATLLETVIQQAGQTYLKPLPIEVEVVIYHVWTKK